jgi:hypothetical protein
MTMKKRLTRLAPLRTGIVFCLLYGIGGLIVVPFFLFAILAGKEGAGGEFAFGLLLPIIYAVAGFITGSIGAALYNLIAKWTGGLQFEVSDDTLVT